jgi:hypothetical protein
MSEEDAKKEQTGWKMYFRDKVVRGHEAESMIFDLVLLLIIIISVAVVILDAIPQVSQKYGNILLIAEWAFTIIFTSEYFLRAICADKSAKYIFSFFGIIDLLSVLPLYVSIFVKGGEIVQVIRLMRIIRLVSRFLRASHSIDRLTRSVLRLDQHLRENEKMLLFFRQSRKTMLFKYLIVLALIVSSLVEYLAGLSELWIILTIFVSFLVLLRAEYVIWSVRFGVTNERILYSKGIIHEHFQSMTYEYVTDISLFQSVYGKIMNTGELIIKTASGEGGELLITNISDPLSIKKMIDGNVASVQAVGRRPRSAVKSEP